jgi:hypothetical protein
MMKYSQERQERINQKCLLLEELGFTIEHQDSCVSFQGIEFDFSAVACDRASIVYTALNAMFAKGRAVGKAEIRQNFKELMEDQS